jgi:hypothetical protein
MRWGFIITSLPQAGKRKGPEAGKSWVERDPPIKKNRRHVAMTPGE